MTLQSFSTDCLRTPDAAFAALENYGFAAHYLNDLKQFAGMRLHYLDVPAPVQKQGQEPGPGSAPVFLCLHGNPSWSYLYRKMIPLFAQHGRVVAPDLFGFGKSDKPRDEAWHTFSKHRQMLLNFVERLDLKDITLVVQDWGGIFGLTLPMEYPKRFSRLLVMNTTLATGSVPSEGFEQWRAYSNSQPDLDVAKMFRRGKPDMTASEAAAYNAPFPDLSYKAALRAFPNMVPRSLDQDGAEVSRQAAKFWREQWSGKSFMAVGKADPVLGLPQMLALKAHIRGCPEPMIIEQGGHFVQEWGDQVAKAALEAFAA